jgi:hypothetical protein
MTDIKLFRISSGQVDELAGTTDTVEKSVRTFAKENFEALLGVRLSASEFTASNGGRIDTLGLGESGCPIDPTSVSLEPGFSRDVLSVGHFGPGDLKITLSKPEELGRAMPLLKRSYDEF